MFPTADAEWRSAGCKPSHAGVLGRPRISFQYAWPPCVLGLLGFRRRSPHGPTIGNTALRANPAYERLRRDDGRRRDGVPRRLDPPGRRLRRVGRDGVAAARRALREPRRRARHARPDQHAPPSLPDPHAHARPAGRPLHVAARALSALGTHRLPGRVRGGAVRAGRACAVGLLDGLRPPLRLPRAGWHRAPERGDHGRRGARDAPHRRARLHEPRRVEGRLTAGRARRGRRSDPEHDRVGRAQARPQPGRAHPDRRRAVLALLRDEGADDGVGCFGAAAQPQAAHASRGDGGGRGVLPGDLRVPADRVPRAGRLARP